jgi:hypothetical protein
LCKFMFRGIFSLFLYTLHNTIKLLGID